MTGQAAAVADPEARQEMAALAERWRPHRSFLFVSEFEQGT
jgi:hypothetical protein